MSLRFRRSIQIAAIVCKHRGRDLPAPQPKAPTVRPTPEWVDRLAPRKKLHPAIVAVIVLAIVTRMSYFAMVMLMPMNSRTIKAPPPKSHSASAAWGVCQQLVGERLRAPKTAEFADFFDSQSRGGPDGEYEIHSYVDAPNGFGALTRNSYVCTVRHERGTSYQLVDLEITPR